MQSNKSYLIQAIYQWVVDHEKTVQLVVNAKKPEVEVPDQYIDGQGRIVLNISPISIRDLDIESDCITFRASFPDGIHQIYVPMDAVMVIFCKENGQGLSFDEKGRVTGDGAHSTTGKKKKGLFKLLK
ncbi:ClpXP protease specificity-enhancing factor SspB [Gammaproteobacteria bacterium]|nr:ClpXP protease specificity-enhancing factor SspB [Gammaproteobacteria bacterium]